MPSDGPERSGWGAISAKKSCQNSGWRDDPRHIAPPQAKAAQLRELRFDDNLAFHPGMTGSALLTAGKRVGTRRLWRKFQCVCQILFELQAIIAIRERQSWRRSRLAACREGTSMASGGAVHRRQCQLNLFTCFHSDYRWLKFKILRRHLNHSRRFLGRFLLCLRER